MTPPPDQGLEDPSQQNIDRWLDTVENFRTAPDQLGRTTFSRTLANALVRLPADRSVVTAVFGPWGCGKTWLLERIVESLEKDHKEEITVCRFSPWELKSPDQILAEFFAVVKENLPPERAKNLVALWELLTESMVVGSIGMTGAVAMMKSCGFDNPGLGILAAFLSPTAKIASAWNKKFQARMKEQGVKSLAEIKTNLAENLEKNLEKPILIVIDDLDRLTHEEIQLMIRLLNTTANLPKLHYLIFGDRKQIASALDPICGNQGDRYLEKLVQNPFQIPEPGENQIRLRLWDGIEKIGVQLDVDLKPQSRRFAAFWEGFLKRRILNLRDCHRLLRAVSFNAGALMRNGTLEVDLIDLLVIDFLRVFDPATYHRLAEETPTSDWCHSNLFSDAEEDAKWIIDLIAASSLDDRTIATFLTFVFPHLGQHMKKLLKQAQLEKMPFRNQTKSSHLGICEHPHPEIYFCLDVSVGSLPEAKVKEFILATSDVFRMVELLTDFSRRGWFSALMKRLELEVDQNDRIVDLGALLQSLLSVSDDLSYTQEPEDETELKRALILMKVILKQIPEEKRKSISLLAIKGSTSVSLSLALISWIREVSNCNRFTDGPPTAFPAPQMTKDEVGSLCAEILPRVQKRYALNHFMKLRFDADRAFWMSNALGPERTQKLLNDSLNIAVDKTWSLIESVALSESKFDLKEWDQDPEKSGIGDRLIKQLKRFAVPSFWEKFLKLEHKAHTKFSSTIFNHLSYALKKLKSEPEDPS